MKGVTLLVTVSIMLILLTGPSSVVFSITHYPDLVFVAVLHAMATLNHSINSALYCVVGTRFRREMINTLLCRRTESQFYNNGSIRQTRNSRKKTMSPSQTCEGAGFPI